MNLIKGPLAHVYQGRPSNEFKDVGDERVSDEKIDKFNDDHLYRVFAMARRFTLACTDSMHPWASVAVLGSHVLGVDAEFGGYC